MLMNRTVTYTNDLTEAAASATVTSLEVTWGGEEVVVGYTNDYRGLRITSVNAGIIGNVTSLECPSWNKLDTGEQRAIAAAVLALKETEFYWGFNKVSMSSVNETRKKRMITGGLIVAAGILLYLAKR